MLNSGIIMLKEVVLLLHYRVIILELSVYKEKSYGTGLFNKEQRDKYGGAY